MRIRNCVFLLTGIVLAGAAAAVHAQAREEGRLLTAGEVLGEVRGSRDQAIPDRLLERAYGIAVIPDLTKVAFFAGGRRGHGVLVVRDRQGHFTSPVFITMTGGSFGWQWGVQSTDIVLVFTTPKGVEGINGGKVTLGADASVAAGPVGRQAEAATDATFQSGGLLLFAQPRRVRRARARRHGHQHRRWGERSLLRQARRRRQRHPRGQHHER